MLGRAIYFPWFSRVHPETPQKCTKEFGSPVAQASWSVKLPITPSKGTMPSVFYLRGLLK